MFVSRWVTLASFVCLVAGAPHGVSFKLKRAAADAQTSLSLDPSQVQTGLEDDGQDVQEAGQVPSLTSSNNFINFCLTQKGVPLTNGQQIIDGSCNPTIMGRILATSAMPSSKFVFPPNGDTSIVENQPFTIQMAIKNLETGNFVNAASNYYAAPAQVNGQGILVGHSHVVVQSIPSLDSTQPLDPTVFAFFKGLNGVAQNGILTADVTAGLPAGFYRLSSINTAANHQPALVAVAQHGNLDDAVYFTVNKAGSNDTSSSNNSTDNATSNSNSTITATNSTSTSTASSSSNSTSTSTTSSTIETSTADANSTSTSTTLSDIATATSTTSSTDSASDATTTATSSSASSTETATSSDSTVASTSTSSSASSATSTGSSNLQTFTGALGGIAAGPVTQSGKEFVAGGNKFQSKANALTRSCDIQHNACADAANKAGNKGALTVAACGAQQEECQKAESK
ncbi:hypothetical protein SISSUDRAFT_353536 [Sistotremastrum suecicum HHB10207 ss-3]|uniref:CHRD domain-containing protein n=1 Tax=Sistotremastrum suecicum HHB10207 ss-3 TaxID=1314776 RepID=A0A166G3Z1_9AGAM|nr:hypothetical protein SISSUDRAFT_353536 [Sistotremastrum suecicum HHB10207 ss-3]